MPRPRRVGRSRFTLALLILASLTVLTLDYRDTGPVQGLRGVAGTVLSPFRGIGNAVASPFRDGWHGIFSYDDLERENEELRRELDRVAGDRVRAEGALAENEELRRLLDLDVPADIQRVNARVVSGPLTSFDATIEIDRGSGDGIRAGMAVVTDAGLVGRVHRVEGGRARVRLITDPDVVVGVRLVEARDVGLARGAGADGTLRVAEGIHPDTPVEVGHQVVTSGYARSFYPPDLPVGTVTEVGETADRTEQTLVIEPLADLHGLTYVAVLICDTDCG